LFKEKIENVVQLLTLGGSLCLLASIVYDWGFYSSLSLSFSDIPSTLTDHVRSALIWSPKIFLGFLVCFMFDLTMKRLENGMSEDEIISSSSNPKMLKRFRDGPYKLMAVSAFILTMAYSLLGDHFLPTLAFSVSICWFMFISWVHNHTTTPTSNYKTLIYNYSTDHFLALFHRLL
jgi:hypothetical protein